MATTEITELNATTVFADGDLALIRKSGETKDRKITQANLIKSIGNPAVKGFTASSDEANKVTLDPSNGTVIDTYYDGMEISFISPFNSTGLVQVRIGALAYKDIFVLNSAAAVELTTTTYIQAIYSAADNKFYQTNAATTQVFTNEYNATGIVAGDNSTTTYTLTSAYGIQKTEYYPRMSLSFNADIASKGGVLVNVDGLGNKILTDKVGDKIANDLVEGQEIFAIYNGTDFIKNLFAETVPEAPELPAEAFDEETGEIIPENVPEDNKVTVTVGNAGNTYTTITAALVDLVNNFGQDGGNRLVTINLSNTYTWNESIILYKNYSWITINSAATTNVTVPEMLNVSKGGAINLTGKYLQPDYQENGNFIYANTESNLVIKDAELTSPNQFKFFGNVTVENTTISNIANKGYTPTYFAINNPSIFNMKNVTFNYDGTGNTTGSAFIFSGIINFENVTINSTLNSNRVVEFRYGGISNLTNCTFNGKNGIYTDTNTTLNMINCNVIASDPATIATLQKANGIFTNCIFRSASVNGVGFQASEGSQITIDGGNYTYDGATTNVNDIIAQGDGTIVRLRNNPIGGTKVVSNGIITTN